MSESSNSANLHSDLGQNPSAEGVSVKRSRRSRLTMEGRDWICHFCKRGYLKMESLVHHIRLKHIMLRGALQLIQSIRLQTRL